MNIIRSKRSIIAFVVFVIAGLLSMISEGANPNKNKGESEMANKQEVKTNDNTHLVPQTEFEGPFFEFDFPSLQIGVAEYEEGPTGCTVFYFPKGAISVIDVRGGDPGTIGGATSDDGPVNAIFFAGGSDYGLEVAAGVTAELFAMRGYSGIVGGVRGAIIYDFFRGNMIYPDKALGRAALKAARPGIFLLGPRGVGPFAGCGAGFGGVQSEGTGQGGAFRQVGSAKIAVFTVVNALGAIVNRQGQVVRGHLDPKAGKRHHFIDLLEQRLNNSENTELPGGNTTLTLVVTNQKLDIRDLRQVARQVHSSMSRAIQPFHTKNDGDVLFAVTTNEIENKALSETALGVLASELAWDAVLSSFRREK